MKKSLHIGTIFGINININYTWLIMFALVVWTLAIGYFPSVLPGAQVSTYWAMAVISAIFLFASLLMHELSHSIVAIKNKLPIRGITLFIFGGVAHMEKEPETPKVEFEMAIAGPLCSLVLGMLFWVITIVLIGWNAPGPVIEVTSYLRFLNIFIAIFNLVPGFPLDGGRIFRAILWHYNRDLKKATRIASDFGKGFAFILMAFGAVNLFMSFITGVWFIFIGLFLLEMAETSYRQVEMNKALAGIHVRDIMSRDVITVNADEKLDRLVEDHFFKYRFTSFPVITNDMLVGLLTLHNVKDVPKEKWPSTTVEQAMVSLSDAIIIAPSAESIAALSKMVSNGIGRLIVIEDQKVVGIVSQRDIMRLFEVRIDLEH
jgi:Zn-dependent protease/predicted transcriptional regulator